MRYFLSGFLLFLGLALSTCTGRYACLKRSGCPAPTPLPPCVLSDLPAPIRSVLTDPKSFLDSTIQVSGRLAHDETTCTLLACSHGCCNGCGASLRLNDEAGRHLALPTGTKGPASCGGDESLICCAYELGADVVATGRFAVWSQTISGPIYALHDATLCRLAP